MITEQIKFYFQVFIGIFVAGLGAYGYAQKKRADHNAIEINELENQIQANDINNEVKEFQVINRDRKERADEDIKNDTPKLTPNTSY